MTAANDRRFDVERVDPKDPDLLAVLRVMPPRTHPDADPDSYKAKERDGWTLGNLERTCIELRSAGGWDDSHVKIDYRDGGAIECEILAQPGPGILPWGWVPRHGTPAKRSQETPRTVVVPPAELSVRGQWMLLALAALLVVDLLARAVGWFL